MDPIEFDLNKQTINERSLSYSTLGRKLKRVLSAMFRGVSVPTTVKGSKQDIQAFVDTLLKEKKYMMAYYNYGLDDPRTYGSKARLDSAIRNFEKTSGITWPFK